MFLILDIGGANSFRRIKQFVWIPIRLRRHDVSDLLLHDEIQLSSAGNSEAVNGLCEDEYVFIEPLGSKHIVKLDMLRILSNDLKELIHKIQTGARSILDPPRHEVAAAIPKKQGRRDQQLKAILSTITELGFEPLKIPNGGKAKIKAECLKKSSLFTIASFGHASKAKITKNLFKLENAQYYRHTNMGK